MTEQGEAVWTVNGGEEDDADNEMKTIYIDEYWR